MDGLMDYQFRQVAPVLLKCWLRFQTNKGAADSIGNAAANEGMILQEKNLSYVQFYVYFVKAILPNPETGKSR